ncbi:MAG: hypothetical protein IJY24_05050 [Clostridia bacterium]|nr:hypothetical protein [Clostridia bacterium]
MENLFSNIGKKIMALAKILCWVGISCSVIAWVSGLIASADSYEPGITILLAFVVLVVGFLISWIGSWTMYAFGQLVDDNQNLRAQLSNLNKEIGELNSNLGWSMQNRRPSTEYAPTPPRPERTAAEPIPASELSIAEPEPEPQATEQSDNRTRLISILGSPKQGYCLACGRLNVTLRRCLLDVDGARSEGYRCEDCIKKLKGN